MSGVRFQAERQSVWKSALVETPYFNVKASEITLIIADTWHLTPETHEQIWPMAEPIISDLAQLPARREDQVFDFE